MINTYKMVELNCDAKIMKGIAKALEKNKINLIKNRKRISYKFLISQKLCLWPP